MKNIYSVIILVALVIVLNSCATVYRCGEPKPMKQPVTWGKRLKTVVSERDKLCANVAFMEKENDGLKSNIVDLTANLNDLTDQHNNLISRNNDLQGRYKDLMDKSLSQTDKLSKALTDKSEELDAKEKLLSDRERALDEMKHIIARQDSITRRLNTILRNALLGFNSDELSVEIRNGKVYVSMSR